MQRARRQLTGAGGGDPDQVGDGRLVGGEEGVEHRRDEDRSAGVRLEGAPQPGRIRVLLAQRVPQRAAPPGALAELLGQLDQRRAGGQVGPVGLDVAGQQLRQREVLEQRHHVGEALVEGVHVDVGRLLVQGAEPIDQRVRRLVHDDVVGQAAEHPLPGQVPAGVAGIGTEVAEAQGATVPVVEDRVLTLEAVREDPQSVAPPPAEPPAQPALEVLQQRAGHRVHHLLVEAGVPLAGREAVLGQQDRIVQVDRRVEPPGAGVVVDHLHQVAARSGPQRLVRHRDGDHLVAGQPRDHRVDRVDLQRPAPRLGVGQRRLRARIRHAAGDLGGRHLTTPRRWAAPAAGSGAAGAGWR